MDIEKAKRIQRYYEYFRWAGIVIVIAAIFIASLV